MSPENKKSRYEILGGVIQRGASNSAVLLTLQENPGMVQDEVIERANATIKERLGEERLEDKKTMGKALRDLQKEGLVEEKRVWDLTEEGREVISSLRGGLKDG